MLDREGEWELELGLQEFEEQFEFEASQHHSPPTLKSRQLLQFQVQDNDFFARISGFDPGSATSRDPDVVALHKRAVQRVVSEIIAVTGRALCVDIDVLGREDPDSDPKPNGPTGDRRAEVIANRIKALVPPTRRPRVRSIAFVGPRSALDGIFDSKSHANRALNRRVDIIMRVNECD